MVGKMDNIFKALCIINNNEKNVISSMQIYLFFKKENDKAETLILFSCMNK